MLTAFARTGCCVGLIATLAGCGGGGDGGTAPQTVAAGAATPGELPPTLLLSEPRHSNAGSDLMLAWSSQGSFGGTIVAQVEFGFSFSPGEAFTLESGGAAATYGFHELRYAGGFFVLTARVDNDVTRGTPFGIDLYPPDVARVPPVVPPCSDNDTAPCSNSLGFLNFMDWPKAAGDSAALLMPRADPAALAYSVRVQSAAGADFVALANGLAGQGATLPRGPARGFDFPSARVALRGCDTGGDCIDSTAQSLTDALLRGVLRLEPEGPAPNGQLALSADGHLLVVKQDTSSVNGLDPQLRIYERQPTRGQRWFTQTQVASPLPGFGRTFALSGDGLTLAVEASPCAAITVLCHDSQVLVYRNLGFGNWSEQARFVGVRSPKLDHGGSRLLTIAIAAQRTGDAIVPFVREGAAWREGAFPAIDYVPLDIALDAQGGTLLVARQGTLANPCGCRAVVVYAADAAAATWRQAAVLRSNKRLDSVGSANDDGFGFASGSTRSLAVSSGGALVVVGASLDSSDASDTVGDPANHNAPQSGAAYVFARQGDGTYALQAFFKARGAAALDRFGHALALDASGRWLYVGARGLAGQVAGVNRNHAADQALPAASPGGAPQGAAAYVFEASGSAWAQRAAAVAPNAPRAAFDTHFGLALSGDGSTLALNTGEAAADGSGLLRRVFVY